MFELVKLYLHNAVTICFLAMSCSCLAQQSITIEVGGILKQTELIEIYDKDNHCFSIDHYQPKWTRVIADFIILCKALHAGGIKPKFIFHRFPNESRRHRQLLTGQVSMPFTTHRVTAQIAQDFYISDAILNHLDTGVGIYVLPSNKTLLQVKSLTDLRNFIAVTSHSWLADIDVLSQIGSPIQTVSTYKHMFQMVAANRADFLLTTLQLGFRTHPIKLAEKCIAS